MEYVIQFIRVQNVRKKYDMKKKNIYPIFIPQVGCLHQCIYCDQFKITKATDIDWAITTESIQVFIKKHRDKQKEIAFFGGSFTCLSFEAMQFYFDKVSPLIDAHTHFRISTRADAITEDILIFLKTNNVKTIELGVQSFSDVELLHSQRGYNAKTAIFACNQIQKQGFNLCVQLLIGLPQANFDTYAETMQRLGKIRPDYVRLYPLIVLRDTELEKMFKNGEYNPLSTDVAIQICSIFLKFCKSHGIKVIKIGLHSDISKDDVVAGPYCMNIGELVKNKI
jgi:histone acetyltransferase (RNA polymerase elongator complex component)